MTAALPALLGGAKEQAKSESTALGFAEALAQHAKDDTGVGALLGSLLDNVDVGDLLSGLVSTDTSASTGKKKKKTAKKDSDSAASGLLGLLGKLLK